VTFEYLDKYVIFCPLDKGKVSSLSTLTIKAGNLPFINGDHLPHNTVYAWSDNKRGLGIGKFESLTVIPVKGLLRILSVSPTIVNDIN
jgi:hypothetical protein